MSTDTSDLVRPTGKLKLYQLKLQQDESVSVELTPKLSYYSKKLGLNEEIKYKMKKFKNVNDII